ncbi:hypothetical protein B7494_g486 [Chlorociboria aeruginascens]|nr:hypothetical protein B7494_g486 [Chlorociboria aeruginascens]
MAHQVKDSFLDLERHRQLLEDNIEKLRKSLRHWQLWDAEYEGLREKIQEGEEEENTPLNREQLVALALTYKGDLVNKKEVQELVGTNISRSAEQVINLLDRRIDYVGENIKSIKSQIETAEHKLTVATVISTPDVRNEEGLPMTEIIEELDDDDNVTSYRTSTPGNAKPQLLEILEKAGVKDIPKSAERESIQEVQEEANEEIHGSVPTASANPAKKGVRFSEDTKPGPEIEKSQTAKRIEQIMSFAKQQETPPSATAIIPTDESPEDAALRREMLQYGMSEIGAVVAELDLEEGSDFTDEEYDDDTDDTDDDEDAFGRSTGQVVDDELRQRMIDVEQRLGARMMENIGNRASDYDIVKEGIGNVTITGREEPTQKAALLTPDKESAKQDVESEESTKKSVRFSESLDIAPAHSTPAPTSTPNQNFTISPISDIIERKLPIQPSTLKPTKKPSRFQSSLANQSNIINGPLAPSIYQTGPSLPLFPAKSAESPRIAPTGPENRTLAPAIIERETPVREPTEPDDFDPELLHQEVATEYHKMRKKIIYRQGGFLQDEESEIVPFTEEEGGPKKLRNARCGRYCSPKRVDPAQNTHKHRRTSTHEHRRTNINTMEVFTNTMEDFNQPGPERIELLERLQEKVGNLPPHFWATCQICDLGALERLLQHDVGIILGVATQASQMVRHWGSSPGYQSRPATPKTPTPQRLTASSSGPSPSTLPPPPKRQKTTDSSGTPKEILPRNINVKKRAEERDNFSCVLTGVEVIEVAHIYPHHSLKREEDKGAPRHIFWASLRLFWSEEKVATWEAKLFPQGIHKKGQEEIYNLISLAPTVHALWGRGLFALKPIFESDDKKTLIVQFFWQKKQGGLLPRMSLTTKPTSTQDLEQITGAHGGHIWLCDKNNKRIQSGDYFELQTDDPIQKPLPSFELLELQWYLHRIQGMAGAVDVDWDEVYLDLDSDSEYTGEVPSLGFDDDVEELSLLSSQPPYSSPSHVHDDKSTLPIQPKHQEAGVEVREGDGAGEEGGDLIM